MAEEENKMNEDIDVEDFSVMLFLGASKIHVDNEQSKRNRMMVSAYSKPMAQMNRMCFRNKIKQKLDDQYKPFIVEIEKGKQPIVDSYGRATYFFCKLGRKRIPIYQPGTFMFESGVVNESPLNVTAHGSQQNGAILGNGCAIFLCKFVAKLCQNYDQEMSMRHCTKTCLQNDCYHQALTDTLTELAYEDKEEHGRLIVMKEALVSLMEEENLEAKYTAMFYAKDFSCIRQISDDKLSTDLTENPPTTDEIQ